MSDEKTLTPIDQRIVDFYGDELTAVLVNVAGREQVLVPIRPICDFLGLSWPGQLERINRDPVLSEIVSTVRVTRTEGQREVTRELMALPLEFLNGWLFGINAGRVKDEIRERLIRYQRDCYHILANAFLERAETAVSPGALELVQIRDMGLAIARMAEQQLALEIRVSTAESRLDRAAAFVGELGRRVKVIEQRTAPGQPIGEEQATEIAQQVKALARLMSEHDPGKNHYQSVFNELYRRFGVSSYKLIPQHKYEAVLEFLEEWRGQVAG